MSLGWVSLCLLVAIFSAPAFLSNVHATTTVELSTVNGSTICPTYLSGFGMAVWNSTTNTCTLSTLLTKQVSPTLCIATFVTGCSLFSIDVLQIDSGVTFSINTTLGGLAVYSSISNYGSIKTTPNAAGITNYGTINNWGTIGINVRSFLQNLPYNNLGIINNYAGAIINNSGNIYNLSTINNSGVINNYCGGTIQDNPVLGNVVQNFPCGLSAPLITTPFGSAFATATPTIVGTSQANVTIMLFDGSTLVGTNTSDLGGNWSITTSPLGAGYQSLFAVATSPLGTSPPSNTLVIDVALTPQQKIQFIITEVDALKANGVLTSTQTRLLLIPLELALLRLSAGVTRAACSQINSFVKTVKSDLSSGILTQAEADQLLNPPVGAFGVLSQLGC